MLTSQLDEFHQLSVALSFQFRGIAAANFGMHPGGNRLTDVHAQLGIAQRRPATFLARPSVPQVVIDATLAAADVIAEIRAHHRPA